MSDFRSRTFCFARSFLKRYNIDIQVMRRATFANGEIYHVFNRGVDKRLIFLDKQDYCRFIHYLFEFNNTIIMEHPARSLKTEMADFRSRPFRSRTFVSDVAGVELVALQQRREVRQPRKLAV